MNSNQLNSHQISSPTLTIMPDYGRTFLWQKDNEQDTYVGLCLTSYHTDHTDDLPLSQPLWQAFIDWQFKFEKTAFDYDKNNQAWTNFRYETPKSWDWQAFHSEGFDLAKRLKHEVGENFKVHYHKCGEDFNACRNTFYEILRDGKVLTLMRHEQKHC